MQSGFPAATLVAALAGLCACRGDAAMKDHGTADVAPAIQAAGAAQPYASLPLIWQQARRLNILCLVAGGGPAQRLPLQASLCEEARAIAADGAPLPVAAVEIGDPAVLDRDSVSLLVHAAIEGGPSGTVIVLAVRPYRAGRPDTDVLFGAAPRTVAVPRGSDASDAAETAIRSALAEILPWRRAS